uniref:N-acetyltransferase domain-containing protein n=1 Tax=Bursaphelenchus xylophilus TaxID=6326 RepID=A0A1I7SD93_BURXY
MQVADEILLTLKDSPIQIFDRTRFNWILPRKNPGFEQLVNQLGVLAAKNKNLRKPLTSMTKFIDSNDENQKIFISWENGENGVIVHGFIKTSKKKLYLRDKNGLPYIENPVCFMDHFFVNGNQEKAIELIDFILQRSTDQVSDLIHSNIRADPIKRAGPDTPQGRKFTRDFGHQSIW